jgi:transposase-like protein
VLRLKIGRRGVSIVPDREEDLVLKLLFLALRQAAKKWTMPIHHWREARNHFTILWPERMPALERVAQ